MVKAIKWYLALTKRLLFKLPFLLVLSVIPLCALTVRIVSNDNHGLVKVALCCETPDDDLYSLIREEYMTQESVLYFYETESVSHAERDVNFGTADCAWVFDKNLSQKAAGYVSHTKNEPLCRVLVSEDTVFTSIAREKLYGTLLGILAKNYSYDFIDGRVDADKDSLFGMFDEERKSYTSDFVDFRYVNSELDLDVSIDYLASPLRGIIAIAVMVCVLSAMLYSIKDASCGLYSCFTFGKSFVLHVASCLAGAVPAGIVAVISMYFAGIGVSPIREAMLMLLFIFALCGFACTLGFLLFNINAFSVVISVAAVMSATLCPVFFNVNKESFISYFLPIHHYLKAVYSYDGVLLLLAYCIVTMLLSCFIYKLKKAK